MVASWTVTCCAWSPFSGCCRGAQPSVCPHCGSRGRAAVLDHPPAEVRNYLQVTKKSKTEQQLINSLVYILVGWLIGWLAVRVDYLLDCWFSGWLVGLLAGWLVDWLNGWLACFLVGWLVQLIGSVDWLICFFVDYSTRLTNCCILMT